MKLSWVTTLLFMTILSACSKPHELEAPCHNFGKYCPQLPINESPIMERPL